MAKTALLPASAMTSPPKPLTALQPPIYSQIPGAASQVAASPDGSLWVLSTQPAGPDKYIWHYTNGTWTNISGLASELAVEPNGNSGAGTLFAVNSGGGVFEYSGGTWTALGGGAGSIAVAGDGTVFVTSNGGGGDQAIWAYQYSWSQMPGSGVSVATSGDPGTYYAPQTIAPGGVYILNSLGEIYYENLPQTSFSLVPGNASEVMATNQGGLLALGYPKNADGNTLYYYDLTAGSWKAIGGVGTSISSDGVHLYISTASGAIYSAPISVVEPYAYTEYPLPSYGKVGVTIAVGSDGNLWYPEGYGIGRMTPTGYFSDFPIPNNGYARDIVAGPNGALWFTESGSEIGEITTSGSFLFYPLPVPSSFPLCITLGPDGNLWFTENSGDKIGKITPSGVITEYPVPTSYSGPLGIAAGPDGNLWFTEASANRIGKITPSGAITEYPLGNNGRIANPIFVFNTITAGPDGNLWFMANYNATGNNAIGRITTSGAITFFPLANGSTADGAIATGSDGNIWFTDYYGNALGSVSPQGVEDGYYPTPTTSSGPTGIISGPGGKLWFAEYGSDKIGSLTP